MTLSRECPMPVLRPVFSALLVFCALAFLSACAAEEEIKLGGDGELCGFDGDCRSTHQCVNFICLPLDPGQRAPCEDICVRFDECNVDQPNCVGDCTNTVRQWSPEAVESFRGCLVEELTCSELLAQDNPPQFCYNRLDLPDDRWSLCQDFISAVQSCDASVDTRFLRNDCRFFARTRSEEIWARTDECVQRVQDNVCPDIYACLNEVFQMENPLVYNP